MATAKDVIAKAKSQVGVHESPSNSNKQKYGLWAKANGVAWCCYFLLWCFWQAGAKVLFYGGSKTGLCLNVYNWAKDKGLLVSTAKLKAGDIVFMKFGSNNRKTDHIGLVEKVRADGYIQTIEGNTSAGNERNGGSVMQRVRSSKSFVAAYRPKYAAEPKPATPAPAKSAAAKPKAKPKAKPAAYELKEVLKKNSRNTTAVKKLQKALGGLTVDGDFGAKTEAAVEKYQKKNKLKVDGIVGKNTAKSLGWKWAGK